MLISGPNMGGKSSYIKQIAIYCILAQIGSYIAASSARVGVLDGIYTRMGANDNIAHGKSTFLVEMEEASRILRNSTNKSLVILDELGRGTSTFDGVAIASAALKYFLDEVQPFTLFVSHYPSVFKEFENHDACVNHHMSFIEANDVGVVTDEESGVKKEKVDSIVFLYKLANGVAGKSYGLNVSRLAGISEDIIQNAARKSSQFQEKMSNLRSFKNAIKFAKTKERYLLNSHEH
eukprot:TCONS_00039896-protein